MAVNICSNVRIHLQIAQAAELGERGFAGPDSGISYRGSGYNFSIPLTAAASKAQLAMVRGMCVC